MKPKSLQCRCCNNDCQLRQATPWVGRQQAQKLTTHIPYHFQSPSICLLICLTLTAGAQRSHHEAHVAHMAQDPSWQQLLLRCKHVTVANSCHLHEWHPEASCHSKKVYRSWHHWAVGLVLKIGYRPRQLSQANPSGMRRRFSGIPPPKCWPPEPHQNSADSAQHVSILTAVH